MLYFIRGIHELDGCLNKKPIKTYRLKESKGQGSQGTYEDSMPVLTRFTPHT